MLSEKEVVVIYSNFQNVIKDLEIFIDTEGIYLAFNKDGQALLIGPDFSEPLGGEAAAVHKSTREEIRHLLAKHRSIHAKNSDPFANSQDIPTPQPD